MKVFHIFIYTAKQTKIFLFVLVFFLVLFLHLFLHKIMMMIIYKWSFSSSSIIVIIEQMMSHIEQLNIDNFDDCVIFDWIHSNWIDSLSLSLSLYSLFLFRYFTLFYWYKEMIINKNLYNILQEKAFITFLKIIKLFFTFCPTNDIY